MLNAVKLPVIADVAIRQDSEGRYCLNDLHRASGSEAKNKPGNWLMLDQTKALASEIEIAGIAAILSKQGLGTYVAKELVYSYAMWISPAFHLKVIRAYDSLVSGQAPSVPQSLPEALRLAASLAEEKERLEAEAETNAPKIAFANKIEVAPDAITVAKAAKILDTGRNRLLSVLRKNGWINRRNEPYQAKIEAGLLDVKLSDWHHPSHGLQQSVTTLITGKGLAKIRGLLAAEPNHA